MYKRQIILRSWIEAGHEFVELEDASTAAPTSAADAASALPATTTTALALMMPGGLPLIRPEWVALGTVCVGFGTAVTLPLLLTIAPPGTVDPSRGDLRALYASGLDANVFNVTSTCL